MIDSDEYLMLSGIQHFAFCKRQWALIHIEQQWTENVRTVEGDIFHERAHSGKQLEKKDGILIARGLQVTSHKLKINGICDVVEFYPDENGIKLFGHRGKYLVCPVEYKRGKPKEDDIDKLQLCAQAMCLEEMLCCDINKGYLFYGEVRRRSEVEFSSILRENVRQISSEMHNMFREKFTPLVKPSKRCNSCSLNQICLPKIIRNASANEYINQVIGGNDEKTP